MCGPAVIYAAESGCRNALIWHLSLQLKEVRREVELSRRRSIKLKAQVDKLQESREGVGWSQHRERVKVTHMQQCTLSTPLCDYYNLFLLISRSRRRFCPFCGCCARWPSRRPPNLNPLVGRTPWTKPWSSCRMWRASWRSATPNRWRLPTLLTSCNLSVSLF